MKAIKNKKRFDARRFLSERKEETKENVEKTNANFNDFSFDNWLEEGSVKEIQIGDGPSGEYKPRSTPTSTLNQNNQEDKKEEFKGDPLKDYEEGTGQSPVGRDGKPVVYEEGCGDPEMDPEEPQAVPADLSPDEAFGAGHTAAVEEIMASIQGLLEDPMDMGPAGEEEESALVVTQLPDHAMEINEEDDEDDEEERIHQQLKRADAMTKKKGDKLTNPVKAGRLGVSESLRVQEDSDQEEWDTAVQKLDDIVNKDWKEKHYYVIKRGEMRSVRKPGTLDPKGHEVVRQRGEDGLRSFASRLKAEGEPYATNLPDELDLEES